MHGIGTFGTNGGIGVQKLDSVNRLFILIIFGLYSINYSIIVILFRYPSYEVNGKFILLYNLRVGH